MSATERGQILMPVDLDECVWGSFYHLGYTFKCFHNKKFKSD